MTAVFLLVVAVLSACGANRNVVLVPDASVVGQPAVVLIFVPSDDLSPDSYIPSYRRFSARWRPSSRYG